jgi:hypothetical protein
MQKPWLTERELDLLRAIHNGDVNCEHRRHRRVSTAATSAA